jgi:hypothetical protein
MIGGHVARLPAAQTDVSVSFAQVTEFLGGEGAAGIHLSRPVSVIYLPSLLGMLPPVPTILLPFFLGMLLPIPTILLPFFLGMLLPIPAL